MSQEKGQVREGFGISQRIREASDLEDELGTSVSTDKVSPELARMEGHFGQYFIQGGSVLGVYRGTTKDGGHIFKPSLFPNGNSEKDLLEGEKYDWRDDFTVLHTPILGFRPCLGGNLNASGRHFDSVKHLGKYLE